MNYNGLIKIKGVYDFFEMKRIPIALTIAGSDSGGGAGIQADMKTFAAFQTYGTTVITAVTAQNTQSVMAVQTLKPDLVTAQIQALAEDIRIDAVKIGMLANQEIITAVTAGIKKHSWRQLVLDPVILAQSGDRLLAADAIVALRERLFPLATIITPNLPEAAFFLNRSVEEVLADPWQAAGSLMKLGARAVLLKGGHRHSADATDWLLMREHKEIFVTPRTATRNLHGTGCTLSAAICALLAHGVKLRDAVARAKEYVSGAIAAGSSMTIGKGAGPVHHFYQLWNPGYDIT